MKATKPASLREKSVPELQQMLEQERAALYKARRDLVFRQTTDVASLKQRRHNIARILTVINEKKRGGEGSVSQAPQRGGRKVRRGVVTSNKMEKTCVVKLERSYQHGLYGKTVRNSRTVKAHDIIGVDIGDTVEIMETRPISKEKRWRVTQIVEKVK